MVAEDYRILLMLGDNLGDFTDDYKGSPAERQAVYEAHAGKWGREWIALPNPGYGSWESAPFGHDYSLTEDEKRALKRDALQPWP
jgi:acid phosphatase